MLNHMLLPSRNLFNGIKILEVKKSIAFPQSDVVDIVGLANPSEVLEKEASGWENMTFIQKHHK